MNKMNKMNRMNKMNKGIKGILGGIGYLIIFALFFKLMIDIDMLCHKIMEGKIAYMKSLNKSEDVILANIILTEGLFISYKMNFGFILGVIVITLHEIYLFLMKKESRVFK